MILRLFQKVRCLGFRDGYLCISGRTAVAAAFTSSVIISCEVPGRDIDAPYLYISDNVLHITESMQNMYNLRFSGSY